MIKDLLNVTGKKKQLFYGAVIILIGITQVEVDIAYSMEHSFLSNVFYGILGIAIAVVGFVGFLRPGLSKKGHEMDFAETFQVDHKVTKDYNALEKMLTKFRSEMTAFFDTAGVPENPPMQEDATQLYMNVAVQQKRRLDRLGVKLDFISERRKYSKKPVQKHEYFDGKYEINEVEEEIEAKRRYSSQGKTLIVKTDSQIAHYSIINARQDGENQVICPNCGTLTTRESLIDGCDYCGTRFQVEDLGKKISEFALRENYETAYAKYKSNRAEYAFYAMMTIFSIMYLFISFCTTILMFDSETSGAGSGDPMNPFLMMAAMVVLVAIFAAIFALPGVALYYAVIFPAMEVKASYTYRNRKNLDKIKKMEETSKAIEKKVRSHDKLFSAAGFYSNIQNKIATVLFANTPEQINVFSEADLSGLLSQYKNILDFDVEDITIEDYKVKDGLQIASVKAELDLVELKGNKAAERREVIRIRVVKDAECKTQAVCAPRVMTCQSCGASLSFEKGLVCDYCSTKVNLKKFDWEIVSVGN